MAHYWHLPGRFLSPGKRHGYADNGHLGLRVLTPVGSAGGAQPEQSHRLRVQGNPNASEKEEIRRAQPFGRQLLGPAGRRLNLTRYGGREKPARRFRWRERRAARGETSHTARARRGDPDRRHPGSRCAPAGDHEAARRPNWYLPRWLQWLPHLDPEETPTGHEAKAAPVSA